MAFPAGVDGRLRQLFLALGLLRGGQMGWLSQVRLPADVFGPSAVKAVARRVEVELAAATVSAWLLDAEVMS